MRHRALHVLPLLLALPLLAACGGGDSAGDGFTRSDSAGVEIASSTAALWPEGERVLGTPEVTIGLVEGAPAYQLDRVQGALRLPDGRIVVLNGGSAELRFFDPGGRHLRTVGRAGEGPGEYRSLAGAIVHDDSLWVYDSGLRRISVLDLHGDYARSFTIEPTGDPIRPNRLYGLAGVLGDTALVMLPRFYPADQRPRPMVYWDSVPNLLYARDGTLLGPIGPPSGMEMQARSDPRPSVGSRPFGRISADALGGERLYYSDADDFSIEVYDGASRLRRLIRLPAREAAPVDAERWRDLYEPRLAELATDPGQEAERRRYLEGADLPEREPAHGSRMAVSEDGRLWVERYAHYWSGDTPAWDVFDEQGRWLGAVLPPADLTIHQVGPWGILAGWRDDLGVEYVSVWGGPEPPR